MHELPLVFLTLLAQTAAGITLFATLALFISKLDSDEYNKVMFVALISISLGGIASLFHLGQPLRAINAFMGVGRSPMSNEIVATVIFGGLLFLTVALGWMKKSLALVKTLGLLASIAALVLIAIIPTIYTLATVPQWNTIFTPMQMILTALSMGAVVVHLFSKERLFAYATVLFVIVSIAIIPMYFAHVNATAPALLQKDLLFWTLKMVFAGLALAAILPTKAKYNAAASFAVVFLLASELCGRIGFYDFWQIGM
ncbi:MAG: dimethyl sulfoxide reductase anchor subunit [Moritella sp.]|uniref:dimethyl sulfoxide reductase anchor subunit family protein n=1 Tax=Moritella sp. TaxID=78556 RepID=UPI00299F9528|nr:DmsC/YnfH family molybdoenzyme membrane anchor subunit [Moritella sp.]MDX2320026.1 dimethyl sulfoxide reductase anchor subunit [Moritella sp.]